MLYQYVYITNIYKCSQYNATTSMAKIQLNHTNTAIKYNTLPSGKTCIQKSYTKNFSKILTANSAEKQTA